MPHSLAQRLRAAHQNRFVGREADVAAFEEALNASEPPFSIFYVHGPGGVGKTALVQELRYCCEDHGVPVHAVDARHVEPTVAGLRDALSDTGLSLPPDASGSDDRRVLVLDTFEALASLYRWVRESLLPNLPATWIVVLSGREPPPPTWRSDLGLQSLLHVRSLRNLDPDDCRAYLDRRDVPPEAQDTILAFSHGHPLALSLAADAYLQDPTTSFAPLDEPDLVGALVQRFLERTPSARHRRALEACALVRVLTEPLLATLLDAAPVDAAPDAPDVPDDRDAHACFQWLRGLSFVESSPDGLFPHDIVRDAVVADLRWRDPDAFDALHQRGRQHRLDALAAVTSTSGTAPSPSTLHEILTDYLFLFRHNPVIQPFFQRLRREWNAQPPPVRDAATADDYDALRRMVVRHEGDASARHFDRWWDAQGDAVQVFRDADDDVAGFVFPLVLDAIPPSERADDPVVDAAWSHLEAHAPLREGESATLFRFWMARDTYQDISPVQSLISAYRVRYSLTTPSLAYTFIPCAEPDRWALLFAYADLHRLEDADVTVGDTTYGLFGHDWRVVPPQAWLELLAERDLSPHMPEPGSTAGPTMLVLSRSDFDAAVKDAFKSYARPDALHGNPLLRSRLIANDTGLDADAETRIGALRDRLRTAAEALQADPKTAKYYRAVRATYLDPQPTQERAAEHLDLAFSTYRRYLKRGIGHVADALWRDELAGAALATRDA